MTSRNEDFVSVGVDIPHPPINNDPAEDPSMKIRRVSKVNYGQDWEDGNGYKNTKSTKSFPFNMFSSSLDSGYQSQVQTGTQENINIVNLHNDVYGPDMEIPMQGPFTEHNVGGHQSRHVEYTGSYAPSSQTRPEAWFLRMSGVVGPDGTTSSVGMVGLDSLSDPGPKAWLYRGFTAKRPVNIRNIRRSNPVLGNYQHNYQIINTCGRFSNPTYLSNLSQPIVFPPNTFTGLATSSMVVSTLLDIRSRQDGLMFDPAGDPGGPNGHFMFNGTYDASYILEGTGSRVCYHHSF